MTLREYFDLWSQAQSVMEDFDPHYSVQPWQSRVIFDQAVQVSPGGTIVELGVCNGRTSAMLSVVARALGLSYTGVDFFGLESSRQEIQEKLETHGLTGLIIEGNTHDIGKQWIEPIDLIFIDAGHDEANVGPDCELWIPRVVPGGVAIFHDYGDDVGAHHAVKTHADQATRGWTRLHEDGGLLVARRPE